MAIITICRGTKSGGEAMAKRLAERLGYPILGREVLQHAAEELGVSETLLREKMESAPRIWDRHAATRRVYVVAVQAALAERVAEGNLVYHGLAGQLLLKDLPGVLRLRLIAPLQLRIQTVMASEGLDRAGAEQFIDRVDRGRERWVKMMYGEDIHDQALYDMVINLETMELPTPCSLVAKTIEQPEFQLTPQVRAVLDDFRLACRVKLALVSVPETRALALDVTASAGTVQVSGSAPLLKTGETGDRIAATARSVPGVTAVRLKLQWFDPYP